MFTPCKCEAITRQGITSGFHFLSLIHLLFCWVLSRAASSTRFIVLGQTRPRIWTHDLADGRRTPIKCWNHYWWKIAFYRITDDLIKSKISSSRKYCFLSINQSWWVLIYTGWARKKKETFQNHCYGFNFKDFAKKFWLNNKIISNVIRKRNLLK